MHMYWKILFHPIEAYKNIKPITLPRCDFSIQICSGKFPRQSSRERFFSYKKKKIYMSTTIYSFQEFLNELWKAFELLLRFIAIFFFLFPSWKFLWINPIYNNIVCGLYSFVIAFYADLFCLELLFCLQYFFMSTTIN